MRDKLIRLICLRKVQIISRFEKKYACGLNWTLVSERLSISLNTFSLDIHLLHKFKEYGIKTFLDSIRQYLSNSLQIDQK